MSTGVFAGEEVPEQNRLARSQAEVLFLVLFSEIVLFNIDCLGEGHLVGLIFAGKGEDLNIHGSQDRQDAVHVTVLRC